MLVDEGKPTAKEDANLLQRVQWFQFKTHSSSYASLKICSLLISEFSATQIQLCTTIKTLQIFEYYTYINYRIKMIFKCKACSSLCFCIWLSVWWQWVHFLSQDEWEFSADREENGNSVKRGVLKLRHQKRILVSSKAKPPIIPK